MLRPGTSLKRYSADGGWAIVTGASDGIGKVFAKELARRGFNILLISRTMSKIDAVAKEIESKYKVKTKGLAVDFASTDPAIWNPIRSSIQSLDRIGLLVNNVGINYGYPTNFVDSTPELDDSIVQVNIKVLTTLTRLVLPEMIKNKRGVIINLSSFAGRIPSPMLAVYSGTKAFVDYFSNALSAEVKPLGIEVLAITPSLVVSNMSKVSRPNLLAGIVLPEPVVRNALGVVGQETRWSPHWFHAVQEWVLNSLPLSTAIGKVNSIHKDVRRRALAKEKREREAKEKNKKAD